MDRRLELHAVLTDIPGVKKVYFQPPESVHLEYPCIIYKRDNIWTEFANNGPYTNKKRYNVTVIDQNPDSAIPDIVKNLPLSRFNTHFTKDRLNHDIFTLFF